VDRIVEEIFVKLSEGEGFRGARRAGWSGTGIAFEEDGRRR
jgi:hypothetical protein